MKECHHLWLLALGLCVASTLALVALWNTSTDRQVEPISSLAFRPMGDSASSVLIGTADWERAALLAVEVESLWKAPDSLTVPPRFLSGPDSVCIRIR